MLKRSALAVLLALLPGAQALTPLPDGSAAFFAGEWSGSGTQGSYCYLDLAADGSGWVLFDGGSGDWRAARISWVNQRQSLQVTQISPQPMAPRLRVMPLEKFQLGTEFNQTLHLTWDGKGGGCYLQKLQASEGHLAAARAAIAGLSRGK